MSTCYLGVGSNLGDRRKNIHSAIKILKERSGIKVKKVSSLYETQAQEAHLPQPQFLNAAIKIETQMPALKLLDELKGIEKALGRTGVKRNFSRIIDLDILFYGKKNINSSRLKIPHPRLKERDFVLSPLKEIEPSLIKSLSKEIKIFSGIPAVQKFTKLIKRQDKSLGFVPTMGCLHKGHFSLIRQAKKDNDFCIVSIFVNPLQFGPQEGYRSYPRDIEKDSILAKSAGADAVFYPDKEAMYLKGHCSYVNVKKLTDRLCGAFRPGHFEGVATVVAKLFNIIQPDIAYFGQKDYQQAVVIKKMVSDLNFPLEIRVMPVVRECDGLSMSSRNTYLSSKEREDAVVLYQALKEAQILVSCGQRKSANIKDKIKEIILSKDAAKIDYIEIVDQHTLESLETVAPGAVIALAVWVGKTRLIDNIILKFGKG